MQERREVAKLDSPDKWLPLEERLLSRKQFSWAGNRRLRSWASHVVLVGLSSAVMVANLVTAGPSLGQDPFAAIIRTTEPLTPEAQLAKFKLPDGFEIQLFAAEPAIQKPMNLAFDGHGRLWMSGSVEYPFAAEPGKGRDQIRILEDTDADGRADKITTFAEHLNIPIGLYPYRDGVIVYSIPNIYFLRDTDGDGRADHREVLYGPLGTPADTHGMQNAFRRGFDGWLYINHGFRNDSTITGRDGSSITLNSGNTYRVRLDGSRVEQFTWGQVNPFGSTFTPEADLVTADCHSKPLTLLLRGGYYSSFGKPHDGLGFAPNMTAHSHGSTAIAGAAYVDGAFPRSWHGSLLVANVMTSRVHRDTLTHHGSTVEAREEPDLLFCDDPWFRPVDLRFGPDGALYIADFYNRIIGHYEVPLDHPQRDRTRGRIWRVVYRGPDRAKDAVPPPLDLAAATADELIATLASPSLDRRMLATDQLTDRLGTSALAPLRRALQATLPPHARVHVMWSLFRLNALEMLDVERLAGDDAAIVRLHAMRVLSEWKLQSRPAESPPANGGEPSADVHSAVVALAIAGLADPDAGVRRAAADALGQHPDLRGIGPLIDALREAVEGDVQLRHMLRLALRNQLRRPSADGKEPFGQLRALKLDPVGREVMAGIATAIPTEQAATYIVEQLERNTPPPAILLARLEHAAAHASDGLVDRIVRLARRHADDDVDLQVQLLRTLQQPRSKLGLPPTASLRAWGADLAAEQVAALDKAGSFWGVTRGDNLWDFESRSSADGGPPTTFLSSLPGGEQGRSVLRSRRFTLPDKLTFYLCGHLGYPDKPARVDNFVVLRLATGGEVVADAVPPRSDVAVRIEWDLSQFAGQEGYLEIVDGVDLPGYAWLAVSRFEPAVVPLGSVGPRVVARRQIALAAVAEELKLVSLLPALENLIKQATTGWQARQAAVKAMVVLRPDPLASALVSLIGRDGMDARRQAVIAEAIVANDGERTREVVRHIMRTSPTRVQQALASELANAADGREFLLTLIEEGVASARLLRAAALREKLLATGERATQVRVERLTASLPAASEELEALLRQRRTSFLAADSSAERGQRHFAKHCAVCHQVKGQGAVIGPQLDGVGNRGLERILEDVLDPNRNLDAAFHVTVVATSDGRVRTGLFRREEGKSLVFAANDGKEFSVLKSEIEDQRKSPLSLMPDNMSTVLSPAEFHDLIKYLTSLREPRGVRTDDSPAVGR